MALTAYVHAGNLHILGHKYSSDKQKAGPNADQFLTQTTCQTLNQSAHAGHYLSNADQCAESGQVHACSLLLYYMVQYIEETDRPDRDEVDTRTFLLWCRDKCQAHGGSFCAPVNTACMDMHTVSAYLVSHWLKLGSHSNCGAAVDTLQSWALLHFSNTLRGPNAPKARCIGESRARWHNACADLIDLKCPGSFHY